MSKIRTSYDEWKTTEPDEDPWLEDWTQGRCPGSGLAVPPQMIVHTGFVMEPLRASAFCPECDQNFPVTDGRLKVHAR